MGTTEALAAFACRLGFDDIPADVRDAARIAMLDCIVTVFAGLGERSVTILRNAALEEAGPGPATVMGTGLRASASTAAMLNGAAAHALDYDNISLTVSGFIGSPVLFALLALAETIPGKVSGRRILEAFVAGWETEAAIARGLGVRHYAKGWHSTATLGHFGAAVGASRLLGLDLAATRFAMGIAGAEASGLRTMIGNMTNPFHVGKAARNGVFAARLARGGFIADPEVIEHPRGFAVAFNGEGGFNLRLMTEGLGERWDLRDPGIVVKVYPCCGLIHSAIDAVLDLGMLHEIRPEAVDRVEVAVHALVPPTMKFPQPATGYEAKFSTGFCIATALLEGAVRLEHFTDRRAGDERVREMMRRVDMVVHPELTEPSTFLEREFSEVAIRLKDGKTLKRRVNRLDNRGSRGRPADLALIRQKAFDCLSAYPHPERIMDALDCLENIESVSDIGDILGLLS